ncbi:MAG: hypothetical protein ACH34U_00285, partial [Cyanobium sp.]
MASFSWLISMRQLLIGQPLPTSAHHEERYGNAEALAILSSDALSSVAYATQEILPITGLIVGLMVIVGTSYRGGLLPPNRYKPISLW